MLRKVKRAIPLKTSPLRPLKLAKSLPNVKQVIEGTEQVQYEVQDARESPIPIQEEETHTNSESTIIPNQTVLSKQIRILNQLNCKQVEQ